LVLKVLMLPLFAGGALALGFVVYTNMRRWLGAPTLESDVLRRLDAREPEHERDPIGPPDSRPSVPTHPVRVTTEAEVAAVIGAEWPLPPAPDALITDQPAVDTDVDAWLTDAEFPDEETAPTQPGMRFERDALDPAPESVPASRGSSNVR
jgi:hypothetical protein